MVRRGIHRVLFLALTLLTGLAGRVASGQEVVGDNWLRGLVLSDYHGWSNCLAIQDTKNDYQVVIAPGVGGRMVQYSHKRVNILYLNPQARGLDLFKTGQEFFVGGYQCDIGPEIHGVPSRPLLSVGTNEWRAPRDYTVETASSADLAIGIRILKSYTMNVDNGEMGLLQRMINVSDRQVRNCIWDRTACLGGGILMVPLNKKSRFQQRWALKKHFKGQYFYDGDEVKGPTAEIHDDVLFVETQEGKFKIGADSSAGWVAYAHGRLLFIKFFPHYPNNEYTDGGNTVEFAWDGTVTEISALSPTMPLNPGQHFDFPERWSLTMLKRKVDSFRDARKLLKQIPPNPFLVR